jgi:protein-disulfide isomerase
VLFWSPGCGHCKRILDEIKTLEANPPEGAPKLFVVSSGDPERNRAMGLRSTVALDVNFSVGQAFGARGTPSAVLLDAEGKIASPLATGGPAVLALAGTRQHEVKSPIA